MSIAAADALLLGRHKHMLTRLRSLGISNDSVLSAIATVPRYLFVDSAFQRRAHDAQLVVPMRYQQTISQPYIVARMTELLFSHLNHTPVALLEIGTGSGYQTAVLATLFKGTLITIERIAELHYQARAHLAQVTRHFITTPQLVLADGHQGYTQGAPFDAIIVTAALTSIPHTLIEQLRVGGVIIAPMHTTEGQWLMQGTKKPSGPLAFQAIEEVNFVPMQTGTT